MRIDPLSLLLAAGLATATLSQGADSGEADALQPTAGIPFRDAATSKDLRAAFQRVHLADPASKFEPVTGEDPSIAGSPKDILKESDILCYNGVATLLPKGSVIHVPDSLKNRIGWRDQSKLVTWTQFYQNNRGWISTMEIDFEQAKGVAPIDEEKTTWLGASTKLVVATFKKGPITMLPPQAPESKLDTEAEANAETSASNPAGAEKTVPAAAAAAAASTRTRPPAAAPAPAKAPKPARFNLKR